MTSRPLAVSAGCCRREPASIMLRVNSKIIMMPALWQVDVSINMVHTYQWASCMMRNIGRQRECEAPSVDEQAGHTDEKQRFLGFETILQHEVNTFVIIII